jgi:hypothetical protein
MLFGIKRGKCVPVRNDCQPHRVQLIFILSSGTETTITGKWSVLYEIVSGNGMKWKCYERISYGTEFVEELR